MTQLPDLTKDDVLRIVQGFAQVARSEGRAVRDVSLFLEVTTLEGFSMEQAEELAAASLRFFDLPVDENVGLRQELCSRTDLVDWASLLHAAWRGEYLCFYSSGSSGVPVRHRYSLRDLTDEAEVAAPFFTSRQRIVSVVPAHHIFGFMHSLWLSKLLAVPVAFAPPLPLADFFSLLREGDVVMGFPFFWQSLLTVVRQQGEGGSMRIPPDVMGVSATGPCPAWVINGLLDKRGSDGKSLIGMWEVYGSTETNGLGIRDGGAEWYSLHAHWATAMLPDGQKGLQRLRDGALLGNPVPPPDVIAWHPTEDRLFRPERRTDKAVQVGGINVYPERVAACIRTHSLVRECVVRLMRPDEGSRLKAFIVPACSLEEAAKAFGRPFRLWLAERLDTASRPKRIRLGETLPQNNMGKAADWD